MKPYFLITIDTEGDNLWARPRSITAHNARYIPRFQDLCDKYGLKPTYLVNYEIATCPDFVEFGKDIIKGNKAEIGMHLHAWNSPPFHKLTDDDYSHQPYLIEYPENVIVEKVKFITGLLEDTFGVKMLSHRSGRWAMNEFYAKTLMDLGYKVDCSVTPHVSWEGEKGNPDAAGGTDYTDFPVGPYFMDDNDIKKPGNTGFLEVPVTIRKDIRKESTLFKGRYIRKWLHPRLLFSGRREVKRYWLRPNGRNLDDMSKLIESAVRSKCIYAEFMFHSSELMPGGSPHFKDEPSIDKLYADLEQLFELAGTDFRGASMIDFYNWFSAKGKSERKDGDV